MRFTEIQCQQLSKHRYILILYYEKSGYQNYVMEEKILAKSIGVLNPNINYNLFNRY